MAHNIVINWRNRTTTTTQDWQLSSGGTVFDLAPKNRRTSNLALSNNTSLGISISTQNEPHRFAALTLTYTYATNTWTFASHTPTLFVLRQNGNTLDLWCSLDNTFLSNLFDIQNISVSEAIFDPKEPDEPYISISGAVFDPREPDATYDVTR